MLNLLGIRAHARAEERRRPPSIRKRDQSITSAGSRSASFLRVPVISSPSHSMEAFNESLDDGIDRVKIELFTNEKTVKERLHLYFIKNQRSSLKLRIGYFLLKIISCIVYLFTIANDDPTQAACYGCEIGNGTNTVARDPCGGEYIVKANRMALLWVSRPLPAYIIQVLIAFVCFAETILLIVLEYKGNIIQQIISFKFLLELFTSVPFIISIGHPMLINLYVPAFLNCWLAKMYLEHMLNDFQLVMMRAQSNLSRQVVILISSIFCIFITCMFGIHYLERANTKYEEFDIPMSLWFVVVTFSTVGYGDAVPSWVPSRIFVAVTICAALMVIPIQLEKMAFYWRERQKQGGTYSSHRAETEKHVILCATYLSSDVLMDFLNEFYAHPMLQTHFVVLLSPSELDATIKMILQVPLWSQRVIYIQGSALKDQDLVRAKADMAQCCFILASRNEADRNKADQATILRTWAVKDFAPMCPLFVQILRPENKFHISFADHVVCEEELKYALLANNCVLPAVSTLTTLLLHTLKGRERSNSPEEWEKNYSRSSGQEIYHRKLEGSLFFHEYVEANFAFAAFHAHKKYGITLIGVQPKGHHCMLNPGPSHIMSATDTCYYINTTKEEHSSITTPKKSMKMTKEQIRREIIEAHLNTVGSSAAEAAMNTNQVSRGSVITRGGAIVDPEEHAGEKGGGGGGGGAAANHNNNNNAPAAVAISIGNSLTVDGGGMGGAPGLNMRRYSRDQRRASIMPVSEECMSNNIIPDTDDGEEISLEYWEQNYAVSCGIHPSRYTKGYPAVLPYTGFYPPQVYLVPDLGEVNPCCLNLTVPCEHRPHNMKNAMEYKFPQKVVIIAAENPTLALFNFIVPLRHHCRPRHELHPVVLMLEQQPDTSFIEAMMCYPMVYYTLGNIERLDDVLKAGICRAEAMVIVDRESSKTAAEEYMADAQCIVAVQTLFKLFPAVSIITELTHPSNMRFMKFRATEFLENSNLSNKEKKAKREGSSTLTSYLYRKPFAAGQVFSASMLDTLLYQAFVKPYIVGITNLLLGLQQNDKSGHLFSMQITEKEMWIRNYGRLFQRLCSTTYEIPIGIYRHCSPAEPVDVEIKYDHDSDSEEAELTSITHYYNMERDRLDETVRQRMEQLGMKPKTLQGDDSSTDVRASRSDRRSRHAYVIINPDYDFPLKVDDIIYLIRPPKDTASPVPQRRRLPPKPASFRRATVRKSSNTRPNQTPPTPSRPLKPVPSPPPPPTPPTIEIRAPSPTLESSA